RYGAGAWLQGGKLVPGLWRFRPEAGSFYYPPRALAGKDGLGAERRPRSPYARGSATFAARHPQETDQAARRAWLYRLLRFRARVLPVFRNLRFGPSQALAGSRNGIPLYRRLSDWHHDQGRRLHAPPAQRDERGRHSDRVLKGRVGPRPGRNQC